MMLTGATRRLNLRRGALLFNVASSSSVRNPVGVGRKGKVNWMPRCSGARGDTVDVYWIGLDKYGGCDGLIKVVGERYLCEEDWEVVESTKDERTKVQRLVSRALRRWVLAQYEGVEGKELAFGKDDKGKPYLRGSRTGVEFNVTHTPSVASVCVGRDRAVGVDAETTSRRTKGGVERIAKRWFSQRELSKLEDMDSPGGTSEVPRMRRFYRLWTLKEAFLKATGLGISSGISLRRCAFDFEDEEVETGESISTKIRFEILGGERGGSDNPVPPEPTLLGEDWGFATFEPRRGDIISLCWRRKEDESAQETKDTLVRPFICTITPEGEITSM
ncbi:4'-phosphopantetheinyl transferase [Chloropicon primus]|nr:4'-phosphopantetheinyl transferase [Chloropicon primus]